MPLDAGLKRLSQPVPPLRGSGISPIHTRGLCPGLTSMPPLRGWFDWSSRMLVHFKIATAVAKQSLEGPLYRITVRLKSL